MADLLKVFLLVLFITLFPIVSARAAQDDGIYTYIFYLYFDNGNLTRDRDFEVPFELIAQEFQGSGRGGAYYGEILSVGNNKLADFSVVLPVGGKGKLSPQAPYFDNAKTANFYNPQNQKLLAIDLAPSGPVCNEDKVCNSDTGETYLNCPNDCSSPTPFVDAIPMPIGRSDFNFFDTFASRLIIAVLILLVILAIVWWLKRKKNISSEIPSPQI